MLNYSNCSVQLLPVTPGLQAAIIKSIESTYALFNFDITVAISPIKLAPVTIIPVPGNVTGAHLVCCIRGLPGRLGYSAPCEQYLNVKSIYSGACIHVYKLTDTLRGFQTSQSTELFTFGCPTNAWSVETGCMYTKF